MWSALNNRLRNWLADCDVRDAAGRPVRVTAHQFRHTVGARMINNDVSMDVVQWMLDHASPEMTARYATIKNRTLRREWERFQQRINIQGELTPLDPAGSPQSEAAWALETSRAPSRRSPTTLRAENQRLRMENSSLKTELAIAYGQQRRASNTWSSLTLRCAPGPHADLRGSARSASRGASG